jgi:hypothetical protein
LSLRNYKIKDRVERIAIEKYRKSGYGITFEDIEREFAVNKAKAQRKLKHSYERGTLFTANNLRSEGIPILQNTSPQHYYPTCIKSEIVENLSKRKNVLVSPTGVNHSTTPLTSGALNTTDRIILETLEGHILPLLPSKPSSEN